MLVTMCFSFFLQVVLVLALLIQLNGVLSSSSNVSDHFALLEIKSKIIGDPQGVLRSWNDSNHFCQWKGVTCGRRHQRVTILNLNQTDLVGSLSSHLGNLSFLRHLRIESNQLQGSIPPEIGCLYRLEKLSLYNNSLTGAIPSNISSCSKLWFINLSFNKLSGKIPNIFGSLLMMKVLDLYTNNFTGGIPPSIGNLTSLEMLDLSSNPLGGSIPDSFNQFKSLQRLNLDEIDLVGAFPLFLCNTSMLQVLSITQNQLHGSLPSNLCLSQPSLQTLYVYLNNFSGSLPPSISNCSELRFIDVGSNDFMGEIAINFAKLLYLIEVILGPNNFENTGLNGMNFFDSLTNCSDLKLLELFDAQIKGVLPDSTGNFSSKLNYLGLYSNYFSGSVPSSIGDLVGLTELSLGENNFTGLIPESIGKLRNLQGTLDLENNAFSGIIPRSIGNLSLVTQVTLGGNKLQGNIPSTIGSCNKLIALVFGGNNLSGTVPKELFQLSSLSQVLDLSSNNLSGVLPQEIGSLTNLGDLNLSKNRLTGELPSSFVSCNSLVSLDLSSNLFHGSLPEELTSLRGLEYVNLSRNNFSGPIPTYLQGMALNHLDLSYNNFEGEVPVTGVFANTSAISIIGNHRLCGGIPELKLPKCTKRDSKRSRKISLRVVVAISISSIVACLALVSLLLVYFCNKKKIDKPSGTLLVESFEKISYGRLFKATQGFSTENLIGTGSFASVYKGVLDENGLTVAIKVLNLQRQGGFKSFMAECDALRRIRHRNLVKVITSCSSLDFQGNDFKALVYEFMPNGSLESWLHSVHHMLDLVQRINIIKDVACALEYLHCRCGSIVVHCDLKPSNILLDADMVAHVGDFGLAKILSLDEVSNVNKSSSSSVIRGTVGYAPPEYGLGNEVSISGDIYSYGILLLEMLTGKRPVDPMFEEGLSLHSYASTALADGIVLQIVDPMLLHKDINENSLISLVKVGVQCSSVSPHDRMDIGVVVHELFSINISRN